MQAEDAVWPMGWREASGDRAARQTSQGAAGERRRREHEEQQVQARDVRGRGEEPGRGPDEGRREKGAWRRSPRFLTMQTSGC